MTTHDNKWSRTYVKAQADGVGLTIRRWGVMAVLAAATLSACGARVDGGNTGSETHWLSACSDDADCGEFSCLCGVCSRSCDSNGQCDEVSDLGAQCAATDAIGGKACGSDVPARICVREDNVDETDSGQSDTAANTSDVSDTTAATSETSDDTRPPSNPVICDGSDDIRLLTQSFGGGPVPDSHAFVHAYGWSFMAIDGKCNFWLSGDAGQVISGTVTDSSVLESYEAAYFQKLGRFADYRPNDGCPDAGQAYVADPSGVALFVCGAVAPPEGWEETQVAVSELATTLTSIGERSQGSLRIALLKEESTGSEVVPWPLDLDPSAWVFEQSEVSASFGRPDFGITFNSGERAESLRAANDGNTSSYGKVFSYTGSAGTAQLRMLLRDDVPPKVAAALAGTQISLYYGPESVGVTCDGGEDCANGLTCMTRSDAAGGSSACNTCIRPEDNGAEWVCQSNADCCGGLTCCVDCGEKSGTCIAEPDPCPTCVENGSNWQPGDEACLPACIPDSICWSECRGECATDNCGACGRSDDCWAAGCEIRELNPFQFDCVAPTDSPNPPETQCAIDATDASLPGVTIHLEADTCEFASGQGGQFRYTVTLNQSLDFTTESSGGGCGLCWSETEPDTWIAFSIDGNQVQYCPECSVGCCAPTEPAEVSLTAESVEGTVDWPGLQWSGPSDTGSEPSGVFPPGSYSATVTLALPGLGQVVATLPIEVTE